MINIYRNILLTIIFKIYDSILQRIHNRIIPLFLLIGIFTDFCLQNPVIFPSISRSYLMAIDLIKNFVLLAICITVAYDKIINYLSKKYGALSSRQLFTVQSSLRSSSLIRKIIKVIFWWTITFWIILGFLIFFLREEIIISIFISLNELLSLYYLCNWIVIAIALMKYYLMFTDWITTVKQNLYSI